MLLELTKAWCLISSLVIFVVHGLLLEAIA
jgi:hypothetical protein